MKLQYSQKMKQKFSNSHYVFCIRKYFSLDIGHEWITDERFYAWCMAGFPSPPPKKSPIELYRSLKREAASNFAERWKWFQEALVLRKTLKSADRKSVGGNVQKLENRSVTPQVPGTLAWVNDVIKRERLFLKLPLSVLTVVKLRLRSNESSSMQVSFLCYLPLLLTGCTCVALRITCEYFSELQYLDLHSRLLLVIHRFPPLFAAPTNLMVWVELARLTTSL